MVMNSPQQFSSQAFQQVKGLNPRVDSSERMNKNLEMMKLLEEDSNFKYAFDKMTVSNGEEVLVFQRAPFLEHINEAKTFKDWKHDDLPYERYGNIFFIDTVAYFFSKDGLLIRNINDVYSGVIPKLELTSLAKWYESLSTVFEKVAREEKEIPPPNILPSGPMSSNEAESSVFYFPMGLWTKGLRDNLGSLGKILKEVSDIRKQNPEKPEDFLEKMKQF